MKIAPFFLLSFGTFLLGLADLPLANAHDKCTLCHAHVSPVAGSADLITTLPALCINCHPDRVGKSEHRIGIKPTSSMTASLPLLNGLITCTTCHDPHGESAALIRFNNERLCSVCHGQ